MSTNANISSSYVGEFAQDYVSAMLLSGNTLANGLIEIKPKEQCSPPNRPSRKTKRYINAVKMWGVNSAKWEAAKEFAENRGWKFQILTEDTLLIGKNNG